jgi:putative transcriptional regulator
MSKENFFVNKFIFFQEKNLNDYFHNALVYIFEHNKNGALGVVVNKIIPISEEKIFKSLNIKSLNNKKHILNGGPVDINKLFVIHDLADEKESLCVADGLSLTSSIDVLKNIGQGKFTNKYRLALGYCGWDAGQLDYEVLKNSWLIIDNNPNIVFDNDPKDLVKEISGKVGYDIDKVQNSEIITKH